MAVVGGGISGIASALILSSRHEIDLIESEPRLGGHAHTVFVSEGNKNIPMDTGFLVYNTLTYPHLTAFLKYLNVKSVDSDMSLAIQAKDGLEWAGTNLASVFAQKKNILNFRFLKMLKDILKFNKQAEENLKISQEKSLTLEELVKFRKLSKEFQIWYLLPMTGSIWSMSYAQSLKFPAETFLNFCINHHLLQVNGRPIWRTIENGSINYVKAAQEKIKNIYLDSPVRSIKKHQQGIEIQYGRHTKVYDRIVMATHAPISRLLLADSFPDLAEYLQAFQTNNNRVVLHTDETQMPKNRVCWSSWNVRANQTPDDEQGISLSYFLNKLQPLGSEKNYFITLNSKDKIHQPINAFNYAHPQFDFSMIQAQKQLPDYQGRHGIYFAGAWTRFGFHEDGILSAVTVGKKLECQPPWI